MSHNESFIIQSNSWKNFIFGQTILFNVQNMYKWRQYRPDLKCSISLLTKAFLINLTHGIQIFPPAQTNTLYNYIYSFLLFSFLFHFVYLPGCEVKARLVPTLWRHLPVSWCPLHHIAGYCSSVKKSWLIS